MTLRRTRINDGEKEIDPKMEELKRQLNTEDGGKILFQKLDKVCQKVYFYKWDENYLTKFQHQDYSLPSPFGRLPHLKKPILAPVSAAII